MNRLFSPPQNQNLTTVDASPFEVYRAPLAYRAPPPTINFSPAEIVRHELACWRGVHVETIQVISHESLEYSFKHKHHLLIAIEQGARHDGELFVEGLPASTARGCSHKLIFIPA